MFDLGIFIAESFNKSQRHLEAKLSGLSELGISGGLVHLHHEATAATLDVEGFLPAINSSQLGQADLNIKGVKHVSHRKYITDAPARLSALIAKCADIGATLFVSSPFSEGQSSSPILAPRGGYRQVNYALAKALTLFLVDEATYYGCKLHIHGLSSEGEVYLLQPARATGLVSISTPAYLFADGPSNFGYDYAGRLAPGLIGPQEKEALLASIKGGKVDVLTSHHYVFAEQLELDTISAEVGVDFTPYLPTWLTGLGSVLGPELYLKLTDSQPKALLAL
jgi:hypothetical protein